MVDVHVTRLSEEQVLGYFWRASSQRDVDRIALLRQLSAVAIARPETWSTAVVRGINPWHIPGLVTPDRCFGCSNGDRRLYWHHVIAVANGGSASKWNLVAICYRCHRSVHPWMPERSDEAESLAPNRWVAVGVLAGDMAAPRPRKETA